MNRTKNELLEASFQVKNETTKGANTADRIGGILYDITEHLGEGGGGGDTLNTPLKEINNAGIGAGSAKQFIGKDNNNNPAWLDSEDILNPILDDLNNSNISPQASSKALGKSSIGTWTWMDVSGGGGGDADPKKIGTQITYFINLNKGVTAEKPLIGEYDSDTDTFTHAASSGSQVWRRTDAGRDVNTQDTWQIWVWFENNVPQYINGPVNMTAGGTNGADSNEREFIYFRTANELVDDAITALSSYFAGCVGTVQAKGGKTFQNEDAVPLNSLGYSFTDQAQGIDDADNKYEYEAYRDSVLDSNGKRVWGIDCFHGPYLRSAYGKEGQDGDGVEYIFYASQAGVAPVLGGVNDPSVWMSDSRYNNYTEEGVKHTYQDDEYIYNQSSWMDDPVDLESADYGPGSKQWVSIRKKKVPAGGTDAVWESYSEPKLWSGVGANGIVDGYITSATNATMPVTTDEEGRISTFTDTCSFDVFHNGTPVAYGNLQDNYSISINAADIVCPSGSGINVNTLTSISNTGVVTVSFSNATNMAGQHISIPVVLHLPDRTTRTHVITVICIKSNKGGESINVYTSSSVIRTDYYHQNAVPSSLQIGVRVGSGSTSNVYLSSISDAHGTAESLGWHFKYYYGQFTRESDYTWQRGPITVDPLSRETTYAVLTVRMYYGELDEIHGITPAFIEEQSIPYVIDGAPGIAAVTYNIDAVSSSITKYATGKISGELKYRITKTIGDTTKYLFPSGGNNYWVLDPDNPTFTELADESVVVNVNGIGVVTSYNIYNSLWFFNQNEANFSVPYSQIIIYSSTHMPLRSAVIPFIVEGQKGDVQSINGTVIRFRNWNEMTNPNSQHTGDELGAVAIGALAASDGVIYKDVMVYETRYFYIAPSYTGSLDPDVVTESGKEPIDTQGNVRTAYYQEIPMLGDAAFQVLLAKYAYIENLTAAEIVITDANQHPVAGMTRGTGTGIYPTGENPIADSKRGDVRIWAGYSGGTANLYDSKFYVTEGGFVHAEDTEISGEINAESGTIGGYTINSNNLQAQQGGQTITLDPSKIKFSQQSTLSTLELTATELFVENGHIEIIGGNNEGNGESLYVGGESVLRSIVLGVGNAPDTNPVNNRSFIFTSADEINLPATAKDGAVYFVKGIGTVLWVNAPQGELIMSCNGAETMDTVRVDRTSCIFIKAGNSSYYGNKAIWVYFQCS